MKKVTIIHWPVSNMASVRIWFVFICTIGLNIFVNFSNAVIWFSETFDDISWKERWIQTEQKEWMGKPFGHFELSSGKVSADPSDKGIRSMDDESYYAISAKLPRFSNRNKTLVIQLTVKHEVKNQSEDLRLFAAVLLKLFPSSLNPKRLNAESKFHIKYGPDFCSAGGKVHAELFYKGKYYSHMGQQWSRTYGDPFVYSPFPWCPQDGFTHLYTFAIFPDNTYQKLIDGKIEESGNIEGAWEMLPPRKLKLETERPYDWDEREFIVDPTEEKPSDWDQPETIPDPFASKPEEWDDVADGEWEHPIIPNPDYKGSWNPTRLIPNPAFKGVWTPQEIDNPDYQEDPELYLFKDIAYIGIESWQQHAGTIVDNILLTDDLEGALKNGTAWQQKFFTVEENHYNDDCEKRQKIVQADMERKKQEIKAFKQRMKKLEL
ncbi:calreticulin-like [Paramacrobiotus metropolitanus]|uniref:calreticulin-like n=1 Tax=Paramacrobiotus metropolitanus TaxID=2943436 RepID=UPI002445A411|nr:calreticulin-like [Paramacrobiotus metropolitanus]